MPNTDIHKILIIGSGPIIIGQACEFDYSGTQACKALRGLGYEIVLVNSNPATIMTDPEMADVTYIEPLNVDRLEQIIAKERPDALLPNLGGQSGLNLCAELAKAGILDKYQVKVIGVQVDAIERGEDRIEFKKSMDALGIEMARSEVAYSVDEALAIADGLGYPVVLRPAYTMGGAGGGLVYNREELERIYKTGRGSVKLRAKYQYDRKNSCIEILEIPYTTNIEAIIDKIFALVKAGKLKDITDVRDETDLNGLKIAIDIKKSANVDVLMHKLYALTPLADSFSCNFNVLIDGKPMTLGVGDILRHWTDFRLGSIRRQLAFDVQKKSDKYHLLLGLSKILADIDKAIAIIRNTEQESMVVPNLMAGFGIDEIQADYIAEIKLRNINKEYILRRLEELETLEKEIAELNETLKNETKMKNIICRQLKNVAKKYGKPRKTEIIQEEEVPALSPEDFIEDYAIKLFLTKGNYFKKIPLSSLRSAGEQKLKEEDRLLVEQEAANRMDILFFSDKQNVYKLKAADAADSKASALGDYLPNLLNMEPEERIVYMTATADYAGQVVFFFENGKAAKVPLSVYTTKMNRKKLVNAYSARSPLVRMQKLDAEQDLLLIRNSDKAVLLNTELIPAGATKNVSGVQVFTLKKNSALTAVFTTEEFQTENPEYYRTKKIPSAGHFIQEKDKAANRLPGQAGLEE